MDNQIEQKFKIAVSGTDINFTCGAEQTVMAAMLHAGKGPLHYGCCGGGCGICKMLVVSGKYRQTKRMSRAHVSEEDQKNNIVLICCIKPLEDMVISKVQ
jgi:ferredoxin